MFWGIESEFMKISPLPVFVTLRLGMQRAQRKSKLLHPTETRHENSICCNNISHLWRSVAFIHLPKAYASGYKYSKPMV